MGLTVFSFTNFIDNSIFIEIGHNIGAIMKIIKRNTIFQTNMKSFQKKKIQKKKAKFNAL